MTTATFDRLAYLETLRAALDAALHDSVATKADLQSELHPMRVDIAVLKWMLGAVLAGVVSLVVRAFAG
jgi:hypothetical protein